MDRHSPTLCPHRDQGADPSRLKIVLASVLPGLGLMLFSIFAYRLFSVTPSRQHLMQPVHPAIEVQQKHASAHAGSPEHPVQDKLQTNTADGKAVTNPPSNR